MDLAFLFFKLRRFIIMKNIILALLLVFGFVGSSYAGDCANGVCFAPVRKVVNITKNIVVAPVRAVVAVAPVRSVVAFATPNRRCCETVASANVCNCSPECNCGSTSSREVVKYQPLRRRLVNRSTTVTRCQ
jgi:hypothetical protein